MITASPYPILLWDQGKAHCGKCHYDIHGMGKVLLCPFCDAALDWNQKIHLGYTHEK